MSKLIFKDGEYTLSELITLRRTSHLHKEGDVVDLLTGETVDINEIDTWRNKYIEELIDLRKKYGSKDCSLLTGITKKVIEERWEKDLQDEFDKGVINTENLKLLIELKLKKEKRKSFHLSFANFYIKNKQKPYPEELSFNDIGRYDKLLKYLTKYSDLKTSNRKDGKILKDKKLTEELQLSELRFFQFMNKLQKNNLIKYIRQPDSNLIIFINPTYSYMLGEIDYTIYNMFKDDIDDFLTKEEIEYLKRIYEVDKIRYTNIISRDNV